MAKPYNKCELVITTIVSFRFLQRAAYVYYFESKRGALNLFFNKWG